VLLSKEQGRVIARVNICSLGLSLVLDNGGGFSTSPWVDGYMFAADTAPLYVAAAGVAMDAAYADAAGRTPDFINAPIAVPATTFTPGVYRWTAAVALVAHTTITLDGGPDDTFIMQVSSREQ
jgi:hypothetical protein